MIVPEDPETSTLKWLFQLDDSKPLNGWKSPNIHLKQWLFRVPGIQKYIHIIYIYIHQFQISICIPENSPRDLQVCRTSTADAQLGRSARWGALTRFGVGPPFFCWVIFPCSMFLTVISCFSFNRYPSNFFWGDVSFSLLCSCFGG